jgi:hypothetical protein
MTNCLLAKLGALSMLIHPRYQIDMSILAFPQFIRKISVSWPTDNSYLMP